MQGQPKKLLPKSKAVRKKAGKRTSLPVYRWNQMATFMADLETKAVSALSPANLHLTRRSAKYAGAPGAKIDLESRVDGAGALNAERPPGGHTVPFILDAR